MEPPRRHHSDRGLPPSRPSAWAPKSGRHFLLVLAAQAHREEQVPHSQVQRHQCDSHLQVVSKELPPYRGAWLSAAATSVAHGYATLALPPWTPGQSLNPRFVAWPLELGLGTHNPCFVAWPLELGLGTHSAATQDEAEDEAEVCVLCCQRRSTVAVCDECKEHYCNECIDTHTCGTNVVC